MSSLLLPRFLAVTRPGEARVNRVVPYPDARSAKIINPGA